MRSLAKRPKGRRNVPAGSRQTARGGSSVAYWLPEMADQKGKNS